MSEAHILALINPKYDDRLFVELRVQYKKTTKFIKYLLYTPNCSECQNKKQFDVNNMYWTCNSMNNLSYCGLTDTRMSASDKDLPVPFYYVRR